MNSNIRTAVALLVFAVGVLASQAHAVGYPYDETATLISQDGVASEQFGAAVAISGDGNTVAIGAPGTGTTQIFVRESGDVWSRQAKITPTNTNPGDLFGTSVALSNNGNRLVAGAPGTNSATVFTRSGTVWTQDTVLLPISGLLTGYGTSVAVSGDGSRVAVGVPTTDYLGTKSGRVLVYLKHIAAWNLEATLGSDNIYPNSYFGDSVTMNAAGTGVWGGSPGQWPIVRYFGRSGTSWSEGTPVNLEAETPGRLGDSIDVSGDGQTLAVGAPNTSSSKGAMFPLYNTTLGWTTQNSGTNTLAGSANGDQLGSSVAASGDGSLLLAGAPGANGPGGQIYAYKKVQSTPNTLWQATTPFGNPDQTPGDLFGSSVDVSSDGKTMVAGAPGADRSSLTDRGTAFIAEDTSYSLTVTKTGSGQITSTPGGINCGGSCSSSFLPGTSVTLTAAPATGQVFTGWSGDCSGTSSCQITVNSAKTVQANFAAAPSSITVQKQGDGSGRITSTPAGINCGTTCQSSFTYGSPVTLKALPDSGSTFAGWGGACASSGTAPTCQVSPDAAIAVTAAFSKVIAHLRISLTGTGDGTVTSDPAGLSCAKSCDGLLPTFTRILLTAHPAPHSRLDGWTGDCKNSRLVCRIVVRADTQLSVKFTSDQAPTPPAAPKRTKVCGQTPGDGAYRFVRAKGISCGAGIKLANKARKATCRRFDGCPTGPPFPITKTYKGSSRVRGWRCHVMVKYEASSVRCRKGSNFVYRAIGS